MKIIENGLIPIYENDNQDTAVDARELHSFLESRDDFTHWVTDKIRQAQLDENTDYIYFTGESMGKGRPAKQILFTLDAAKHIALLQNTPKGKEVRTYFIEAEKRAKYQVKALSRKELAQMVIEAEERAELLESKVTHQAKQLTAAAPKLEVYDRFMASETATSIGVFAKMIKWGPNKLFKALRDLGILFKRGYDNIPYQEYLDRGYFTVKTTPIKMGERVENRAVTLINPKGQEWLYRKLEKVGE